MTRSDYKKTRARKLTAILQSKNRLEHVKLIAHIIDSIST